MSKTLDKFQQELLEWKGRQFPDATLYSVAVHLDEELRELLAELGNPFGSWEDIDEEMADVLIMLCQYANFRGKSMMELVERKMQTNYSRQWGDPDEKGVVRHLP